MSSENDSVAQSLQIEKCSLVLLDVAGTTTSLNFVKETLFPYASKEAASFLKSKWDEEAVKDCVQLLKQGDEELDVEGAATRVKELTEKDSDNKGLKSLQGLIYKQGYENGDLKAQIFEDVSEFLESTSKSRNIAIYSTGSVDSQKLLFSHTTSGDLSSHISKYFDQTVGSKIESDSYKKIAKDSELEPEEIVFVTDSADEAKAAKTAGFTAVLIAREGNAALSDDVTKEFSVIKSLKELPLDKAAGKRKITEEAAEAKPPKIAKTDSDEKVEVTKEVVEDESMEVDAVVEEKPAEVAVSEEAKPTAETETNGKVPEEKTDSEETPKSTTNDNDAEMKPVEEEKDKTATETIPQPSEKKPDDVEMAEEVTKKPEDSNTTTEEVKVSEPVEKKEATTTKDKPVEETKDAAKETKEAAKETKETPVEEVKDKAPVEEVKESTPVEEVKEKAPVEEVKETKSVEEVKETATVEKVAESTVEEVKEKVVVEAKEETKENGKTDENVPVENGSAKNGETPEVKIEEKENKSVLANGVENGNKEVSEVEKNNDKESETEETKKDEEETDVKVKKLEPSAESKAVSVEV